MKPFWTLARRYRFSAAHTLRSPGLSDEENRRLFGKCANPSGHGHDYLVDVMVTAASLDRDVVMDRGELDALVKREIESRFAWMNVNETFGPGFLTSGENLARAVWELLSPHMPPGRRLSIRLVETAKNSFVYRGPA
ncbi:MAG: 6-carboxytetrahydropterin synthase [Candidatus Zixiibacteriota bacterium]